MSPRQMTIEAIAVLVGAVVGLIVVDLIAWLFFNTAFLGILASPGRWIIILLTVALFAYYYRSLPPTGAAIASFFTGVALPLIAEKIVFGSSLPVASLLFLYVLFALAALFTYRFVHANGTVRGIADETRRSDRTL